MTISNTSNLFEIEKNVIAVRSKDNWKAVSVDINDISTEIVLLQN